MKARILILKLFFFSGLIAQIPCPSGKEGNIWYFGKNAGLDFSSGSPLPLYNNAMDTYEASTILTDSDGNLLFYSNGDRVWNRNHEEMPGSRGPSGLGARPAESSTHLLALPQPGKPGIYYLFYPEVHDFIIVSNPELDTIRKMYYAIIDMTQEGGLGDVVQKKIQLFEKTTQKIAATPHCNGTDWWLLTHESGSNRFFAWLLDSSGIASTPVVSATGIGNKGLGAQKAGALKISPNGQYVAMVDNVRISTSMNATWDAHNELFRFDNSTGAVYDAIVLGDSLRSSYAAEFSPDSRKVYFNTVDSFSRGLLQYDLSVYTRSAILDSRKFLGDFSIGATGMFQLAPDGKIYIVKNFTSKFDVIQHPNLDGAACGFTGIGYIMDTLKNNLGLPTFPAGYFAPGKPWIEGPKKICLEDGMQKFYVAGHCLSDAAYAWQVNPLLPGGVPPLLSAIGDSLSVLFSSPGIYQVLVKETWRCGEKMDTLTVRVESCADCVFDFNWLPSDTAVCKGKNAFVRFFTNADSILLSNPNTGTTQPVAADSILFNSVQADSCYQLRLLKNACDSVILFCISLSGEPDLSLDTVRICAGDSVEVFGNWVKEEMLLEQWIQSAGDCDSLSQIRVIILPTAAGFDSLTLCAGDSVFISGDWIQQPGAYSFSLQTTAGCDSTYTVNISAASPISVEISAQATCPGQTNGMMNVQSGSADYQILWEDVQNAGWARTNLEAGMYAFTIVDENNCRKMYTAVIDTFETETVQLMLPDSIIEFGENVIISILANQQGSINWNPDMGLSCGDCFSPVATPTETTRYQFIFTDENGCVTIRSFTIFVNEKKPDLIYVPTAFSPNGDLINDRLLVYASQNVRVSTFRVFDRWGELVFQKTDPNPNQESDGWDGSFRGKPASQDLFVWMAEIVLDDGTKKIFAGETLLLR